MTEKSKSNLHQQNSIHKIPIIAFEGINRSGKGTQLELLKEICKKSNIDFLELRGDGVRQGLGVEEGDPFGLWWQERSSKPHNKRTKEEQHYSAYTLAKELTEWKNKAVALKKQLILLDRSLLSRATFVIEVEKPMNNLLSVEDLYPIQIDEKIKLQDVTPDIIFELVVSKKVALSRINPNDPKDMLRSVLINKNHDIFYQAKKRLPKIIQDRIVSIDSTQPPQKVLDIVLRAIHIKFPFLKNLH